MIFKHFQQKIKWRLAEFLLQAQELVSFPALFYGRIFKKVTVWLEEITVRSISIIQSMDRTGLNAYHVRRINKILSHTQRKHRISSLDEISTFPVAGKEYIRNFFAVYPKEKLKNFFSVTTSGFTGPPVRFYLHNKVLLRRSSAIPYAMKFVGISHRSRILRTNFDRLYYEHQSLYIPMRDIRRLSPKDVIKKITSYDPRVLLGTTSDLLLFSKFFKENSLQHNFTAVFVLGEYLTANQRFYFENLFKANTYSLYGSSEIGVIGQECREKNGIHINEDLVRLEIVHENTATNAVEEMAGTIVVTSLYNTEPPLIRYSLGDMGKIIKGPCPCGFGSIRISFEGRINEFIMLPYNKKFPLFKLSDSIVQIPKILLHQFEQPSVNELRIKVTLSDTVNESEILKKIKTNILMSLGNEGRAMHVVVQSVDVVDRVGLISKTPILVRNTKPD